MRRRGLVIEHFRITRSESDNVAAFLPPDYGDRRRAVSLTNRCRRRRK
jgi:hypothetical protein